MDWLATCHATTTFVLLSTAASAWGIPRYFRVGSTDRLSDRSLLRSPQLAVILEKMLDELLLKVFIRLLEIGRLHQDGKRDKSDEDLYPLLNHANLGRFLHRSRDTWGQRSDFS